jgi:uncharacterized membrane protein
VSGPQSAPPAPKHRMDPIELTVNRILVGGVALAVALMAIGLVLRLADGQRMPSHVVSLADLPSLLGAFDPAAFLSLGLIVLIATPFVRVAGTIVAFAREHDRRYVLITAVVLVVMCVGVALGRA